MAPTWAPPPPPDLFTTRVWWHEEEMEKWVSMTNNERGESAGGSGRGGFVSETEGEGHGTLGVFHFFVILPRLGIRNHG